MTFRKADKFVPDLGIDLLKLNVLGATRRDTGEPDCRIQLLRILPPGCENITKRITWLVPSFRLRLCR